MKKWYLVLLMVLLAACGGQAADEESGETAVSQSEEPVDAVVTDVPAEPASAAPTANLTDGCVTDFDAETDYFPNKVSAEYATGFVVEYFNNYKIVTITTPFPEATDPVSYVLVQCGTPAPEGVDAPMFEVPVQSMISMSTSYLPALEKLDVVQALVGVDSADFAYSELIRSRVDAGEVAAVGGGSTVNVELVVELEPDLVMTSSSGFAEIDAEPKLTEVGVPVALNADFLADTPLARAEWVKYISLFFNKEAEATAVFDEVAVEYEALAALADTAVSSPTVFTDTPYEGTWYMAGGGSFTAQLIADAGGSYIYADDTSTASLFLDFETVFNDAATADFWLNVGLYGSRDDLLATDERFGDFAAFENGNVYNYDARVSENGGLDYFESGVANPQLVLADLIAIFHPELLPNHVFYYYRQLP